MAAAAVSLDRNNTNTNATRSDRFFRRRRFPPFKMYLPKKRRLDERRRVTKKLLFAVSLLLLLLLLLLFPRLHSSPFPLSREEYFATGVGGWLVGWSLAFATANKKERGKSMDCV